MSRAVLVLGQHRSGTSAVASILHHLGIPMGTPGVIATATHTVDGWPAFDSNPHGQFEDDDFVRLFLEGHGTWELPTWWQCNWDAHKALQALVKEREAAHPLWGLKTPQLCFAMPYFIDMLDDPVVICTHRDFDDMVDSLAKRDNMPRPVCEQIQALYFRLFVNAGEAAARKGVPILDLAFDYIMFKPELAVADMLSFMGIDDAPHRYDKAIASIQPAHA